VHAGTKVSQPSKAQSLTSLVFYGAVLLIAYLAFQIVRPFLGEIGWAVVLAICLAPAQARLAKRFGAMRTAALLTLLVVFVLIVPALVAIGMLVSEGPQVVAYVNMGDDELLIDYRLPSDHSTPIEVARRNNFYGIRFRVRNDGDLPAAAELLGEALTQSS